MAYNWQLPDWPRFTYDISEAQPAIIDFAQEIGEVDGFLEGLPDNLKQETLVQIMLTEAVKTSEIERKYVSRQDSRTFGTLFFESKVVLVPCSHTKNTTH